MPQQGTPAPSAPLCYFKNNQAIQAINAAIALKATQTDVAIALGAKADQVSVDASLAQKANQIAVDSLATAVDAKASQNTVDSLRYIVDGKASNFTVENLSTHVVNGLALKADQVSVDANLAQKANQTAVDAGLALKADQVVVDSLSVVVDAKAEQTALTLLDIAIGTKAENSDLNSFIGTTNTAFSDVQASMILKADMEYVAAAVDVKADTAALITALATKYSVADANARIAAEKVFFNAYSAANFLAGPDGVTEMDYNML